MKKLTIGISLFCFAVLVFFSQCTQKQAETETASNEAKPNYGGHESQVKWGEHLVTVLDCNVCHTPKKMTDRGPVLDSTLLLSGHPSKMPPPDVDRKMIESNGYALAGPLFTSWTGPWGVSFTANLTPDESGIGTWQESNFITAIREGKFKGMSNARPLLPPMPWEAYKNLSDDEIKAIFAYLKSIPPVKNVVPEPMPPLAAAVK